MWLRWGGDHAPTIARRSASEPGVGRWPSGAAAVESGNIREGEARQQAFSAIEGHYGKVDYSTRALGIAIECALPHA